jgi:outer membrane protein assembly factor BamB
MGPGIIVDLPQKRIYSMAVDGGINAVDLSTGKVVWDSKEAAKPIGFSAGKLFGQADSGPRTNELQVVALDPRTGQKLTAARAPLPAQVLASVVPTSAGTFSAVTSSLPGGETIVSWRFVKQIPRAIPPNTKANLPASGAAPAAPASAERQTSSGSFLFRPTTGSLDAVVSDLEPQNVTQPEIRTLEEPATIPGRKFLSADGRAFVVSTRTGSDSEFNNYTLTVYDRQTNARLGEFKSQVAAVPFFVANSTVVFESGPTVQRVPAGLIRQPSTVRAVELGTGKEIWSVPIRDTTYRGPFPP